jgi:hypothetical protein
LNPVYVLSTTCYHCLVRVTSPPTTSRSTVSLGSLLSLFVDFLQMRVSISTACPKSRKNLTRRSSRDSRSWTFPVVSWWSCFPTSRSSSSYAVGRPQARDHRWCRREITHAPTGQHLLGILQKALLLNFFFNLFLVINCALSSSTNSISWWSNLSLSREVQLNGARFYGILRLRPIATNTIC